MRGEGKNGDFFIVSAFVCFVVIFYVCKYATAVVTASRTGYQMALRVEPVSENAQAFRALTPFRCQSFVRKDDTYPLLLLPLSPLSLGAVGSVVYLSGAPWGHRGALVIVIAVP